MSKRAAAPLSADEIERYARHIVLSEIGGAGQQKIKAAKIAIVGAGGLGSPALLYLAAAGVGTLTIIDDDVVSLSNLQRQIIHQTAAVGLLKTESAQRTLRDINPNCAINCVEKRLTAENAIEQLKGHDVVLDGSDNFETRYLVADICEALCVPLVSGALGRFDGSLTTLAPHLKSEAGVPNPRYRDIFPSPPAPGTVPNCAQAGVLGAVAGTIGTIQATEALKLVLGIGQPLIGKLLLFDALSMRFETIVYGRSVRHS